MKLKKLIVIPLIGLLTCSLCSSQTIVNSISPNEKIFLVRTKQFNEFLDRFNYKVNFNGDPVDSVFTSKFPREKMINSLFDLKDARIDPADILYSDEYIKRKSEFINEVINKNLKIYKYSENIISEARSRIFYKGVPHLISIFLNQEIVGNDRVKWVINNAEGDVFNFLKTDTTMIRFIPPSSNETDFINLKRALEDTSYLQYYATKDYNQSNLSVFYYMLNSGILKFEYVEHINYHIIDLPGWCIKVKEFSRNEMNSGWLIYDVTYNDLNLPGYLKSLN